MFASQPNPVIYSYTACTYIQPSASIDIYRAHLDAIHHLTTEMKPSDSLILLGDFNFGDAVTWIDSDSGFHFIATTGVSESAKSIIARESTKNLLDYGLFQLSNFQNASGNVLDLIYTNDPELSTVSPADFLLLPTHKSDKFHTGTGMYDRMRT